MITFPKSLHLWRVCLAVLVSPALRAEQPTPSLQLLHAQIMIATNQPTDNRAVSFYIKNISESPVTVATRILRKSLVAHQEGQPAVLTLGIDSHRTIYDNPIIQSLCDMAPVTLHAGEVAGIGTSFRAPEDLDALILSYKIPSPVGQRYGLWEGRVDSETIDLTHLPERGHITYLAPTETKTWFEPHETGELYTQRVKGENLEHKWLFKREEPLVNARLVLVGPDGEATVILNDATMNQVTTWFSVRLHEPMMSRAQPKTWRISHGYSRIGDNTYAESKGFELPGDRVEVIDYATEATLNATGRTPLATYAVTTGETATPYTLQLEYSPFP